MRELTMHQMSEMDGSFGFRGFFTGFLCGASVAALAVAGFASFTVAPLATVVGRRLFVAAAGAACAAAFML